MNAEIYRTSLCAQNEPHLAKFIGLEFFIWQSNYHKHMASAACEFFRVKRRNILDRLSPTHLSPAKFLQTRLKAKLPNN